MGEEVVVDYSALLPAARMLCNSSVVGRASEMVVTWSLVALLLGLALMISSRDLIGMALADPQNVDCYFDQSCDELPGYTLGWHLQVVGWRVASAAAISLIASISALVLSRYLRGRRPLDSGRPQA